jgi:hypothetical protein
MLSTQLEYRCTGLECFLEVWNAFDRFGTLSTGLECFRHSWNTFVLCWIAFYWVGMLSPELEYLCTELECFLEGWNDFNGVGIPLYRIGMLSRGL